MKADNTSWKRALCSCLSLAGIETLIAIAQSDSFAAAADKLGVSKAAVTLQLKRLEKATGERLVNRSHGAGRGVEREPHTLTLKGADLYRRVRRPMTELRAAMDSYLSH